MHFSSKDHAIGDKGFVHRSFTPIITRIQVKYLKWHTTPYNMYVLGNSPKFSGYYIYKYFADSVESSKITSSNWKNLSAVNKGSTFKANSMPDELIINNEHILDSNTITSKLNECFSSIAQILNRNNTGTNQVDLTKLIEYVNIIHILIYPVLLLSKYSQS